MEDALARWRSEKTAAYLSGGVAAAEPDAARVRLFRQIGASLPIIPFLLGLPHGVAVAAAISGTALFVVGAVLSLFSGRGALLGGLRMLLIGSAAAIATYMIGSLFNVSGL